MSSGEDQNQHAGTPRAYGEEFTALTLRVAALEAQLATLIRPAAAPPPTPPAPTPPRGRLDQSEAQSLPPIQMRGHLDRSEAQSLPSTRGHLDRSEGQFHRPSRSGETPEFRPTPPPPPPRSLEDRLGAQIFNIVGAAALIIGASWALKLAIDHGLIGPIARILIGLAAGVALILWSERFRRRAFPAFSFSLKAVGAGVLYLSLWASFQIYGVLPANAAFAAMLLVTAWNAFMAWSQDAELLAAYALAGGLATPLLLSTGGDHEAFLFLYLAALDAATILLLRFKPWPRLLPPAFLATAVYFIGWYSRFFHPYTPQPPRYYPVAVRVWDAQSFETALFTLLFAALFALPSLRAWSKPRPLNPVGEDSVPHSSTASSSMSESTSQPGPATSVIRDVLLPFANAAFLSLALYSVLQDSGLHSALPWLMLALSALYLGLMRLQATPLARAIHLALAIIFLTVAIPLKASGQSLTTAWLIEGLVLFWASTRVQTSASSESQAPARVLQLLSAAGYILGLLSLAIHWSWFNFNPQDSFFNANLGSALVAIASLASIAWLASRLTASITPLTLSLAAIDLVALLLLLREIFLPQLILGFLGMPLRYQAYPAGFHVSNVLSTAFADALVALLVLAAASWSAHRLATANSSAHATRLRTLAAASFVAFNLFTLLTGVREISALWTAAPGMVDVDGGVQRSLAISAFLMLYGAALLAAGFWRRDSFTRWQALLLLIFTILKVFLSDVSGLSQGYRVASFLGLGALLMAVSFAYQRDWLGLKAAAAAPTPPPQDPE